MEILLVGSVAFDSIETPFGKKDDVLGGSATYFSTAASFFTSVQLVAVVGEDFPDEPRQFLTSRGVDLTGLQTRPGATFRWKGRYGYDLNEAHTASLLSGGIRFPGQHRPRASTGSAAAGRQAKVDCL